MTRRKIKHSRQVEARKALPYACCKNCGTRLEGPYCHNCGQYALDLNQSMWSFVKEYFSNAYQMDRRLWPTLKLLFSRPGALTQEFMAGKVNSYVHPLKMNMFLLVVVVLVFLMSAGLFGKPELGTSGDVDADKVMRLLEAIKGAVRSYMPLLILLMSPFLGFAVKLLNRKTGKPYMEHFVFALHYNAFLEIVLMLYLSLDRFCHFKGIGAIFAVLIMVYLTLAQRRVYGSSWPKSVMKSAIVNFIYFMTLIVAIVLILTVVVMANAEVFNME